MLILGLGPIPYLGILGAGIAGAAANLLSMVVLLAIIYCRDIPIRLRGAELRYLRPSLPITGKILRMGIPMGLQAVVMAGSTLAIIDLVNREGAMTVAAYGLANQVWTYIQMPGMAVGMAVSAMAAHNIGAGRWDRVDRIVRAGLWMNLALTGCLVLLSLVFGNEVLSIFLGGSANVITSATHINSIAGWAFVFQALAMVLASVARANGATIVPLLVMLVAFVPVRLSAAHGLRPLLGADAIWWSLMLSGGALLLLTALYYASGHWCKRLPDDGAASTFRRIDDNGRSAQAAIANTSSSPAEQRVAKSVSADVEQQSLDAMITQLLDGVALSAISWRRVRERRIQKAGLDPASASRRHPSGKSYAAVEVLYSRRAFREFIQKYEY